MAATGSASARQDFEALAAVVEERRRDRRFPYSCTQRVAFRSGAKLPATSDYVEVQCHDISAGGLSFWSKDRALPSRDLIIELGQPPHYLMVTALVRHCTPFTVSEQQLFLIGCEFTGRF
jgi:hypothetical protein